VGTKQSTPNLFGFLLDPSLCCLVHANSHMLKNYFTAPASL
jgi:hypothetical protein